VSYSDSLLASGERVMRVAHQHWFVLVWRARWAILAIIIAALAGGFRALNSKESGLLWDLIGWIVLALLVVGIASFVWGVLTFRAQEFIITNRRVMHVEGVINKKASDSSLEKINDAVLTESIFGRMFGFGDLEVLTASESGIERLDKLRDAKDFKKTMLEAKHELEIELTRPTMPPLRTTETTTVQSAPAQPDPVPAPAPAWAAAAAAPGAAAATDVPAAADVPPVPDVPPVSPATPADDAPTAPVAADDDVAANLSRLADLRDRGLITPEEYEAKRAEQLNRL
jgi:PH (Pleckstrin Homology) domain-containing protein/putative oligomerization/nucleic acid binding protein